MPNHQARLVAFTVFNRDPHPEIGPHLMYLGLESSNHLPHTNWPDNCTAAHVGEACVEEPLGSDSRFTQMRVSGTPRAGLTLDFLSLVHVDAFSHMSKGFVWLPFPPSAHDILNADSRATLDAGLAILRENLEHGDGRLAFELVNREAFTAAQLRRVYEAVLGVTIDQSNFRKRLDRWADAGLVRELSRRTPTTTRPAQLYACV